MTKRREKLPTVEADITIWDPITSGHASVVVREPDFTHDDYWGTIITDAGQVEVRRGWAIIDYGGNRFASMPADDVDAYFEPAVEPAGESVMKKIAKRLSAEKVADE